MNGLKMCAPEVIPIVNIWSAVIFPIYKPLLIHKNRQWFGIKLSISLCAQLTHCVYIKVKMFYKQCAISSRDRMHLLERWVNEQPFAIFSFYFIEIIPYYYIELNEWWAIYIAILYARRLSYSNKCEWAIRKSACVFRCFLINAWINHLHQPQMQIWGTLVRMIPLNDFDLRLMKVSLPDWINPDAWCHPQHLPNYPNFFSFIWEKVRPYY